MLTTQTKKVYHYGPIAIVALIIALAILACGNGETHYTISTSTGLYRSTNDEDPIRFLNAGERVAPAMSGDLICETVSPGGISMRLCYIEVVDTGEKGWVLQKRLR